MLWEGGARLLLSCSLLYLLCMRLTLSLETCKPTSGYECKTNTVQAYSIGAFLVVQTTHMIVRDTAFEGWSAK